MLVAYKQMRLPGLFRFAKNRGKVQQEDVGEKTLGRGKMQIVDSMSIIEKLKFSSTNEARITVASLSCEGGRGYLQNSAWCFAAAAF